MPLPDSLADFVSGQVGHDCKEKLTKYDIDYIVSYVPLPPAGPDAVWRREKVVRDLKYDLQALHPNKWEGWTMITFAIKVGDHRWYD